MTGSASDPLDWQPHIRNKPRREALANRFRDADDPFKIVIVRDMWLTGFDAPCLHTMYVDKPMRGHGLMQAIARVNRVFRDKPGGLVVDYLGLAHELKQALATYTESGGTGTHRARSGRGGRRDAGEVRGLLRPLPRLRPVDMGDRHAGRAAGAAAAGAGAHPGAGGRQEPAAARRAGAVAGLCAGRARTTRRCASATMSPSSRRCAPPREASAGRGEDGTRNWTWRCGRSSRAPSPPKAWWTSSPPPACKKPDISILSDEFLAEVRGMPQRNLAVELLRKLLSGEIHTRRRKNVVQARSFAEMLEQSIRRYQNRAIEAAQVIEELIGLARDMREANARGEELGLSDENWPSTTRWRPTTAP